MFVLILLTPTLACTNVASPPNRAVDQKQATAKQQPDSSFQRESMYFSVDQGQNWVSLNSNLPDLRVRAILKTDGYLLVATDTSIFRSAIDQIHWEQVFSGCQVISLDYSDGHIVAGGVLGVLLSADGGEQWTWIHQKGAAHNTAILNRQIFVMNVSGDLFVSAD